MRFCRNMSLLTGGSSKLIKHRPVPIRASSNARTGIGRFVKRYFKVPGACQTSYDAQPGTVRCNPTIYILNKNRPVPVRCVQTPARTAPGRCHFTLIDPTKRRTGAVEF